ncbi:MAG: exopolysaccharide Pel transporter PelG [Pseudomonadota bacterium]
MSGIGFELHRLLKDERRQNRASLARSMDSRASTPWLPPFVMIAAAGVITGAALGQGETLEKTAGLFVCLVAVSLFACAAPTAAIARIASDPNAAVVRPLILANLSTTALSLVCVMLLWHPLAGLFNLSPTQPVVLSAVLLANLWPPTVALLIRRQANGVAVPILIGLVALTSVWFALRLVHGTDLTVQTPLILVLSLLALLLGIVVALGISLDRDRKAAENSLISSLDLTTWAPAVFTVIMLTDRFLLSNAGEAAGSPLRSITPALVTLLCTVPALWFFVRHLEPQLGQQRRELLNAVYEGESLIHIEQLLTSFVSSTQVGLMTFAKLLGVAAVGSVLIGPELLSSLGLDTTEIGRLQLAVISSAMLAQFLACVSLFWLLQLRTHALLVTVMGLGIYLVLTIAAMQSHFFHTPVAAALAASMTSVLSLSVLRHAIDSLSVDLLLN